MTDFSNCKHIDLTDEMLSYKDGSLLASIEGNSFGDQIIHYRVYQFSNHEGVTCSGFETIGTVMYHEGNHISESEMLIEAKRLLSKLSV